jgi:hypothetical protein
LKQIARRLAVPALSAVLAVLTVTCGAPSVSPATTGLAPSIPAESPQSATLSAPSVSAGTPAPSGPTTGFAFAADDVLAYYASQGYTCSAPEPSSKAAGFTVRTCEIVDPQGRTRGVGVVTDPAGGLANGFASVEGADGETILAPTDALDPLAGFLGAMLGADQGTALLEWLAGHLGDEYAQTDIGPIRVATFTEAADDHSKLYVELANRAYLDAPPVQAP